jgi:DNA-binding transcriptional MerR regulator
MYGPDELRRLAFLKVAHTLGIPLDTAAAVLGAPSPQWRRAVQDQIAELDQLIGQAHDAQRFLRHALNCPANHPARDCPTMTAALDQLVAGMTVDQLRADHAAPGNPSRPADNGPRPWPAATTGHRDRPTPAAAKPTTGRRQR